MSAAGTQAAMGSAAVAPAHVLSTPAMHQPVALLSQSMHLSGAQAPTERLWEPKETWARTEARHARSGADPGRSRIQLPRWAAQAGAVGRA